jgi:hypothetical protein
MRHSGRMSHRAPIEIIVQDSPFTRRHIPCYHINTLRIT